VTTGFISDEQLGALYRGADLFVLPSLFEGFGMPPIEAMSLGTPALVSDIPPLREITLGYAHYLADPTDAAGMAGHIQSIVEQGAAAKPTSEAVARLRRTFAPSTIAAQYLDVLFGAPSGPRVPCPNAVSPGAAHPS
jgi:glycosyltransferase involved in cell wall biosynthesis